MSIFMMTAAEEIFSYLFFLSSLQFLLFHLNQALYCNDHRQINDLKEEEHYIHLYKRI
jgi:hypothetical protein